MFKLQTQYGFVLVEFQTRSRSCNTLVETDKRMGVTNSLAVVVGHSRAPCSGLVHALSHCALCVDRMPPGPFGYPPLGQGRSLLHSDEVWARGQSSYEVKHTAGGSFRWT